MPDTFFWIAFGVVAATIMTVDLGFLNRKAHVIQPREAAIWSGVWVGTALLFNLGILLLQGRQRGLEFLTGYLIELSLSVDNIFVFVLIFSYFGVPAAYQHRVLFWGIIGAIVFRGIFIAGGIVLLEKFHWLAYILGLLLIWGGLQLFRQKATSVDPSKNRALRLFRRFVPMTPHFHEAKLLCRVDGKLLATPLFAVLVVVETTDIVFALDSIPAILAITRDPFIVLTSNVCAILGLRSLYFLFASLVERLRHLHYGLAVVLCFVGVKMILSGKYHLPIGISLGFVAVVLGTSVVTSLLAGRRDRAETADAREEVGH